MSGNSELAWSLLGWLGLILALAGFADWTIAWLPTRFGSPEWEFGTVVATFAGIPLIAMGFTAMLGAALARGIRWQLIAISIAMLVFAMTLLGALIIFALDVPVALQVVNGPARLGIYKAIAKTAFLGGLFLVAHGVAAVIVLRSLRARPEPGR